MITTIKVKDLIKYLVITTGIIVSVVLISRYFFYIKNKKMDEDTFKHDKNYTFLSCLNISIPLAKTIQITDNNQDKDESKEDRTLKKVSSRSGFIRILDLELPIIEEKEEQENNASTVTEPSKSDEEKVAERVEIKDTYTNTYKSVTIKNLTNIKLTEDMIKPDYKVKNKKDIIIYHTHTCESYTPTKENTYKASGNYRTTDLKYSVVKVGDVLTNELKKLKFSVTHNNTKHDYPAYTGSYTRSLETVEKILKEQKDTEIVFDIHRDAVGSKGTYGPTVEIKGEKVAQLMFVIGTNDGGGKHPNWKNNLKFAVAVQEKANEMYPGLFRSINLRSATFNQKVANAASIIEVGATGNTLEEAEASMKYLAKVLKEVLK